MSAVLNISDTIKTLSERIETEINRLSDDTQASNLKDSLVFIGNWQDAIPRSIWVDSLLTAIDVRCWGIIRTQAVNGSAVMLSLNQLLKETLGYSNATISRVIFILRLSRWISLCSTLRTQNGKFRGNIYAIHDNPVSLEDAIYLDSHYIEFVKKQTSHKNHSVSGLAKSVWQGISDTVQQQKAFQPSAINQGVYTGLNQLVNQQGPKTNQLIHVYNLNLAKNSQVQKLNEATKHQVQFLNVVNKKNEINKNQQDSIRVQKLNVAPICSSRCSSSSLNKKTSTTCVTDIPELAENEIQENLIYPKVFNANENKLAKMYLQKIEAESRQNFLDETAAQIKQHSKTSNPIRNPIGFLAWLCNEHGKGNTYLTSAYLKWQEQRERKENSDKMLKQQQKELTVAALNKSSIKPIVMKGKQDKNKTSPENRWKGMNYAVKPK